MKSLLRLLPALGIVLITSSCISVRVAADYDRQANFTEYRSYAFFKPGIDKAEISDLDKRRILRAIDVEMQKRGFVRSENPDLLISIFTTEQERVNVYNNFGWGWGWGWGWGPGFWGPGGNFATVNTQTVGSLYIDLIDADRKELVWQGKGTGSLNNTNNVEKKEARIREFVAKILEEYPPMVVAAN